MIGIDRMTDPAQIHRAILRATRQGDFAIAEIQRVTQRSETLRRESDTITAKPLRDITPADVERIIQITREVERLLA
ncbi:MAG TPA: hypothetical protein VEJ63_05655, partial [Planctomycetota bacterium]|nr:hypothetical protein [Planctomycetota bacterium]